MEWFSLAAKSDMDLRVIAYSSVAVILFTIAWVILRSIRKWAENRVENLYRH